MEGSLATVHHRTHDAPLLSQDKHMMLPTTACLCSRGISIINMKRRTLCDDALIRFKRHLCVTIHVPIFDQLSLGYDMLVLLLLLLQCML